MRPSRSIQRFVAVGSVLATAACADDLGPNLAPQTACDLVCAFSAALDPDGPKSKPPPPQRAAASTTLPKKTTAPGRAPPEPDKRVASLGGAGKPKREPPLVAPVALVRPAAVASPARVVLPARAPQPAPAEDRPPPPSGAVVIPGAAPSVAPTFDGSGAAPQH